jgi:hypothetical protein
VCEAAKWIGIVTGGSLAILHIWYIWPPWPPSYVDRTARVLPYWRFVLLDFLVFLAAVATWLAHCEL